MQYTRSTRQLILALLIMAMAMVAGRSYAAALGGAHPQPPPGAMVTGTILYDDYDALLQDPLMVEIYRGNHCIARALSDKGMFAIDLQGLVKADDIFSVVLRPQVPHRAHRWYRLHFGATRRIATLASGQNLELIIEVRRCRAPWVLARLGLIKQPRSRGRMLYINNI
jgi:hypothetical protein